MGDKLVRRASIPNYHHVLILKVERVVPVGTMEHPTVKIPNILDAFRAVWHIAETDGSDEKPGVFDVAAS
jgi:hypothetical protein